MEASGDDRCSEGIVFELDIYGAAFSPELVCDLENSLKSAELDCRVSGEKAPAAGPELTCDLLLKLAVNVSAPLICSAVKCVARCLSRCLINHQIEVGRIVIEPPGERIVVETCPAAGIVLHDTDYIKVLEKVFSFLDSHNDSEGRIEEVRVPWDINELLYNLSSYPVKARRFEKWGIAYSDGTRRIYDSYAGRFVDPCHS